MLRNLKVVVFAVVLSYAVPCLGAEKAAPAGCRLTEDDPLRAEVDRIMKAGAEFEAQQRTALEEKVNLLGRDKGWSKAEEEAYLRKVVLVGNNESWEQMLTVGAAFIRVCEERTDGSQRAEAVRLFRELYAVEEKQWQSIHESVDKELAAYRQAPGN